ncbi:MAG: hypothetical protein EZS28_041845, partial [Streblomastix strix]
MVFEPPTPSVNFFYLSVGLKFVSNQCCYTLMGFSSVITISPFTKVICLPQLYRIFNDYTPPTSCASQLVIKLLAV